MSMASGSRPIADVLRDLVLETPPNVVQGSWRDRAAGAAAGRAARRAARAGST